MFSSSSSTKSTTSSTQFKTSVDNGGTAVENAQLKYGVISADPFTGMWNPVFYLQSTDNHVIGTIVGTTFSTDKSKRLVQDKEDDAVKFHLDKDKKEVTLTINKDLKWNNGEAVTADDIVATYMLMGNPKYTDNVRYDASYETIEGMKEYHEGKADSISGVVKKDDRTVVIKYSKLEPALQWGGGFISTFLNKGQVEAASKDFTKFAEADLNKKPLSYGPYYLDKEVNGETVLAKANPYFFKKDKVKVKDIEFKQVTTAQVSAKIKSGELDYVADLNPNIYEGIKDAKNGTVLGQPDYYVSYIGFKLGTWDKDAGQVKVNPDAKAADVKVRQAFGYAVDWDQLNEKIYKGLRTTPTGSGIYPPRVEMFYDKDGKKFTKDVEKAKKLLDEAGLKDTDGDGLREDKNGKKLTFNFATRNSGNDYDQTLADTFIKSWKEVGLDVKLTDGKLMSPKDWTQRVQADDPQIDLFLGAWGLGTDPNPSAILGEKSKLNLQRYIDDSLKADMEKMGTEEMFDDTKLVETYKKFDQDFTNAYPWLPFSWNTEMTYVNKRIKNYDLTKRNSGEQQFYELELTADEPAKN